MSTIDVTDDSGQVQRIIMSLSLRLNKAFRDFEDSISCIKLAPYSQLLLNKVHVIKLVQW